MTNQAILTVIGSSAERVCACRYTVLRCGNFEYTKKLCKRFVVPACSDHTGMHPFRLAALLLQERRINFCPGSAYPSAFAPLKPCPAIQISIGDGIAHSRHINTHLAGHCAQSGNWNISRDDSFSKTWIFLALEIQVERSHSCSISRRRSATVGIVHRHFDCSRALHKQLVCCEGCHTHERLL